MEFKRIVVLANSIKFGGRCVAGRIVNGTQEPVGGWIRPVSGEFDGELAPRHMKLEGGAPLNVLDIVEVPLGAYANDPLHPEDWIIDVSRLWKRVGRLPVRTLGSLEEHPTDLWLESTFRTDRASRSFLSKRADYQSLYLIRPSNPHLELSFEYNPFINRKQKKQRLKFIYGGQEYGMNLTDPIYTERHGIAFPAPGAKASIIDLPCGNNCLLCVSVTPELKGCHYKIVATILELEKRGRKEGGK